MLMVSRSWAVHKS